MIEFDHVGFGYRSGPVWNRSTTVALRDITLSVAEGETVGLVGESGSGKTTLGMIAVGLLQPTEGTYRFGGQPMNRARQRTGEVQAVFQQPAWALNPRLTVERSVAEPLTVAGANTRRERRTAVAELLDRVGLHPSLAQRYPHQLSGGQRQRVSVARALITKPRFVLFDEVVTALDVSVQAQLLNLIADLQAEHGFGALFISHDLAVVRYISRRIAVLYRAELVDVADADTFYGVPEHPYSRELCAAISSSFHLSNVDDEEIR